MSRRAREPVGGVGGRLRETRQWLRVSQAALAAATGVTQSFVSTIELGKSGPSAELVAGLARYGVRGDWLLRGEGPMTADQESRVSDAPRSLIGYTGIRVVGTVRAGFGRTLPEDRVARHVQLDLGPHDGHDAFATIVEGRSMEPEFRAGDLIVIDKTCPVCDGDVGVVVYRGEVTLKRIASDREHVILISLREGIAPVVIPKEGPDARIVGRVIKLVRDLWRQKGRDAI